MQLGPDPRKITRPRVSHGHPPLPGADGGIAPPVLVGGAAGEAGEAVGG